MPRMPPCPMSATTTHVRSWHCPQLMSKSVAPATSMGPPSAQVTRNLVGGNGSIAGTPPPPPPPPYSISSPTSQGLVFTCLLCRAGLSPDPSPETSTPTCSPRKTSVLQGRLPVPDYPCRFPPVYFPPSAPHRLPKDVPLPYICGLGAGDPAGNVPSPCTKSRHCCGWVPGSQGLPTE